MDTLLQLTYFDLLQPQILLATFVGVLVGLVVGLLPGLTTSLGMVLLLPFTFGMEPIPAFGMLLGLYAAGFTGGGFTAILYNIPGTPAASLTGLDGYQMTRRGEAARALGLVITASVAGGLISRSVLTAVAPPLAKVALKFGAAELLWLMVAVLSLISLFSEGGYLRGFAMAVIGLMVTTVGMDEITGMYRFTGGIRELGAGISMLPALVGLFAIPQFIDLILHGQPIRADQRMSSLAARILPTWADLKMTAKNIAGGSLIGSFIGALPGANSTMASAISYGLSKRMSKNPERFGKGSAEGIVSVESADNGVSGGALIPLLTLGIPGDTVTAVLLGAFTIQGMTPGPLLMAEKPQIMQAIFGVLLIANLLNMFLSFGLARQLIRLAATPKQYIAPIIGVMVVVGIYSLRNLMLDVYIMLAFGLLGFLMRRYNFPVLPMLLGLILGSEFEKNLRLALRVGDGNLLHTVTKSGISLTLFSFAVVAFLIPIVLSVIKARRAPADQEEERAAAAG